MQALLGESLEVSLGLSDVDGARAAVGPPQDQIHHKASRRVILA
jgi:hypothetical protein